MPAGDHPASNRPEDDPVDDPFEQWVERLARLVLHLTSLGDRYEAALALNGGRESRARVARLRRVSRVARDALVGLALGGRTERSQSAGESVDGRLESAP